ncbi:amino acid ABC transporter ATP-binding protein [Clostridium sp. 'White wine YQ']|uniref:amino acid ABC transporter ATP-binding protein n=1 Tax=Clostridium sp. 'White wine YQ' TaxID=3027474 RepID=UPI0023651600|nr:amino acid ABC transporter ATP-binding protein [Clostridium sp. 'White wine YQ']MDD7794671.1 amino acid ABC transporter ATP-binding protein [Clostridium sp. 'White wine YQ']
MINVKNLDKAFGNNHILKSVNLQVNEGETTVIIGPSGSGKTTLLRCMNLLEIPNDGEITLGEVTLGFSNNKKLTEKEIISLRKQTGMVFQGFNLFPHMTVINNIMEGQVTVLKRSKEEAKKKAEILLEKVGLAEKANSYPYELSGGQQQRVAIARAMAMDPKILLFDEPTSALDPELEAEVLKVIKELAKEGMTMIVVTHNMNFARDVANKVVFMEEGIIIQEGTPGEIFNHTENDRMKRFLNIVG